MTDEEIKRTLGQLKVCHGHRNAAARRLDISQHEMVIRCRWLETHGYELPRRVVCGNAKAYLPKPETIAAKTAEIRARWDDAEHVRRSKGMASEGDVIPEVEFTQKRNGQPF